MTIPTLAPKRDRHREDAHENSRFPGHFPHRVFANDLLSVDSGQMKGRGPGGYVAINHRKALGARLTPIHGDRRPRHETRALRDQESHHVGHLLGPTEAAPRQLMFYELRHLLPVFLDASVPAPPR